MIDTVVIKHRTYRGLEVTKPQNFNPEFRKRSYQDLSQHEKESVYHRRERPHLNKFVLQRLGGDTYFPKVEIYEFIPKGECRVDYGIRIEFSVPKLWRGQNVLEISAEDYTQIRTILSDRLKQRGIKVEIWTLDGMSVSAVHIGKNIILPEDINLQDLLHKLKKLEVNKTFDINEKEFRNGGDSVHYYNSSRAVIIYDKIKDIQKTKNKSSDKEKTMQEKLLIEGVSVDGLQILRFEYRLQKSHVVNKYASIINKPQGSHLIFKDLFNEELWKKILVDIWEELLTLPANQATLFEENDPVDLFHKLIRVMGPRKKHSAHSLNKVLTDFGILSAIPKIGARPLFNEIGRIWSKKALKRLEGRIQHTTSEINNMSLSRPLKFLDDAIRNPQKLTLEALENRVNINK